MGGPLGIPDSRSQGLQGAIDHHDLTREAIGDPAEHIAGRRHHLEPGRNTSARGDSHVRPDGGPLPHTDAREPDGRRDPLPAGQDLDPLAQTLIHEWRTA